MYEEDQLNFPTCVASASPQMCIKKKIPKLGGKKVELRFFFSLLYNLTYMSAIVVITKNRKTTVENVITSIIT